MSFVLPSLEELQAPLECDLFLCVYLAQKVTMKYLELSRVEKAFICRSQSGTKCKTKGISQLKATSSWLLNTPELSPTHTTKMVLHWLKNEKSTFFEYPSMGKKF